MTMRPLDATLAVRGNENDPRLGACLVADAPDVIIVGCADDTGVRNSGGRPGASEGPNTIRRWLYRQTLGMNAELDGLRLIDLGDVLPGARLEETHAELERVVADAFTRAPVVVFLGGGHDLAYASHSGLLSGSEGRVAIHNVDTHLDVRPPRADGTVTSGTPFFRLYERWGERIGSLVELGIQSQHNARAHREWLEARGGCVVTLDELRAKGSTQVIAETRDADAQFVTLSVDLDVLSAAEGPGVSAPPGDGLAARQLVELCALLGADERVKLLELVELSPPHDENERTARTAALCVWHFLAALKQRKG